MIVRAAVKINLYIHGYPEEIIIPCHRHSDAFQILHDFGFKKLEDFKELEQGFLNEKWEFLTRIEAWKEARRCNQLLKSYEEDTTPPMRLFSEDIW